MFDQVETGMKVRIEVQNNWSDKREIERKVIFTDDHLVSVVPLVLPRTDVHCPLRSRLEIKLMSSADFSPRPNTK